VANQAGLYDVVRTAAMMTDRVLVAYSGGKDSVVTLDLCHKHFKHVAVFFMYQVPGLSFQERTLRWAEARYGIEILRLPHFGTSWAFREGLLAQFDDSVSRVTVADTYAYVREQLGTYWIAGGERIADSIIRRAMIVKSGAIDDKRGRISPLAHWRKAHVKSYITQHGLHVSEEAQALGFSFRELAPRDLAAVKQHYPDDFEKIVRMYPMAEAAVKRYEFFGK
jgi:phosphoadenosine phosphosulfate reductase